jgi:hypothetical protein
MYADLSLSFSLFLSYDMDASDAATFYKENTYIENTYIEDTGAAAAAAGILRDREQIQIKKLNPKP